MLGVLVTSLNSEKDGLPGGFLLDVGAEAFEEFGILSLGHRSEDWCWKPASRVHCSHTEKYDQETVCSRWLMIKLLIINLHRQLCGMPSGGTWWFNIYVFKWTPSTRSASLTINWLKIHPAALLYVITCLSTGAEAAVWNKISKKYSRLGHPCVKTTKLI